MPGSTPWLESIPAIIPLSKFDSLILSFSWCSCIAVSSAIKTPYEKSEVLPYKLSTWHKDLLGPESKTPSQVSTIGISRNITQSDTNAIGVTDTVNGNSADLTLDLSVVGDELLLTAEHGEQQAISKINVGNIVSGEDKYYIFGNDGTSINQGILSIPIDTESNTPLYAYNVHKDKIETDVLNNIYMDTSSTLKISYIKSYENNTPKNLGYKITKNKTYTTGISSYLFVNKQQEYIERIKGNLSDRFDYKSRGSRWYKISNIMIAQTVSSSSYILGCNDNDMFNVDMALNIQASNSGLKIVSVKFNKEIYLERNNPNIFFSSYSEINLLDSEPNWS